MKTPLQLIAEYGAPVDSSISAVRFFCDREDLSRQEYQERIRDLIGLHGLPDCESYYFARCLFLNIVQEIVKANTQAVIPDLDVLYATAIDKTDDYIINNSWTVTRFNIAHGLRETEEVDPETGDVIVKVSKGVKKETTERLFKELKSKAGTRQDIIEAFVRETGMSKAGATTYFHKLKKELGFVEKTADGSKKAEKGESKQSLAEDLYQHSEDKSKAVIIELFIQKLGTSKLGAQTYFYNCKRKFQPLTEA